MIREDFVVQRGLTIWFTGLSGAGKTTLCSAVAELLRAGGVVAEVLDGDEVRKNLSADLGFGRSDREENIRRITVVAERLVAEKKVVLVGAISPFRSMREGARQRIEAFVEVYVNASLATCIERDTKGLYQRALAGEIDDFTGISGPYEAPLTPDVECHTDEESVEASAAKVMAVVARALQGELHNVTA